jgi:hypothetical protein
MEGIKVWLINIRAYFWIYKDIMSQRRKDLYVFTISKN